MEISRSFTERASASFASLGFPTHHHHHHRADRTLRGTVGARSPRRT
jgi:hypothetical protein